MSGWQAPWGSFRPLRVRPHGAAATGGRSSGRSPSMSFWTPNQPLLHPAEELPGQRIGRAPGRSALRTRSSIPGGPSLPPLQLSESTAFAGSSFGPNLTAPSRELSRPGFRRAPTGELPGCCGRHRPRSGPGTERRGSGFRGEDKPRGVSRARRASGMLPGSPCQAPS